MTRSEVEAGQFDWGALYERLDVISSSLTPPDQNFSARSFMRAFNSASDAENFTSLAWVRFSNYKRILKDRSKRLRLKIKVACEKLKREHIFEGFTKEEVDGYCLGKIPKLVRRLEETDNLFQDVCLYMDAINKVSGRIKHFREDLGRQLKLREIERSGSNDG